MYIHGNIPSINNSYWILSRYGKKIILLKSLKREIVRGTYLSRNDGIVCLRQYINGSKVKSVCPDRVVWQYTLAAYPSRKKDVMSWFFLSQSWTCFWLEMFYRYLFILQKRLCIMYQILEKNKRFLPQLGLALGTFIWPSDLFFSFSIMNTLKMPTSNYICLINVYLITSHRVRPMCFSRDVCGVWHAL